MVFFFLNMTFLWPLLNFLLTETVPTLSNFFTIVQVTLVGGWRAPVEVLKHWMLGTSANSSQCWILLCFVSEIGNSPICENTLILEYSYES